MDLVTLAGLSGESRLVSVLGRDGPPSIFKSVECTNTPTVVPR